jgi:Mn-dependent DtxR family transcriptional regulator
MPGHSFGFVAQSTACNAVHSVEQRLARWLLMADHRMDRQEFPLTQEFAAMMLGTTRPTVTVVADELQKAGLIRYHRGHVTIVDGERLERASCECDKTVTTLLLDVTASRGSDTSGEFGPFATREVSDEVAQGRGTIACPSPSATKRLFT